MSSDRGVDPKLAGEAASLSAAFPAAQAARLPSSGTRLTQATLAGDGETQARRLGSGVTASMTLRTSATVSGRAVAVEPLSKGGCGSYSMASCIASAT